MINASLFVVVLPICYCKKISMFSLFQHFVSYPIFSLIFCFFEIHFIVVNVD